MASCSDVVCRLRGPITAVMALEHVLRGEQNAGPKRAESAPGGCDEAAGAARIEVFPSLDAYHEPLLRVEAAPTPR